jgi:membrane-associated phospholipid phosphatase
MIEERRSALYASVLFGGYVLLGFLTSHAPPDALDRSGEGLIGVGVPFARILTGLGTLPSYVLICVALLVFAMVRRAWLPRALILIATLIVAWCASDAGKFFFSRPRMEHWIGIHETSYSYASGHATLSLAFYGLWLRFLMRDDASIAVRRLQATGIILLIIGIGWSRAALGAHYLTDILGGYALGGALLCAAGGCEKLFLRTNRPL